MEPTEAPNLDDQYKYYWEGDLCDYAGQEDGPLLCTGSCFAGGGAVGCRGTLESALSSQGWVQALRDLYSFDGTALCLSVC